MLNRSALERRNRGYQRLQGRKDDLVGTEDSMVAELLCIMLHGLVTLNTGPSHRTYNSKSESKVN